MKRTVAALLLAATWWGCMQDAPVNPRGWASQAVEDAWTFLDIFFVFRERLPLDPKVYSTPQALYQSVREPYTVYYEHQIAAWFISALTSVTVDLGAVLDSVTTGALVRDIYGDSPAARAGMRIGDTIVAVDDKLCAGYPVDSVYEWLSGREGETRQVVVGRSGGRRQLTITLSAYMAPTVFTDSLDSMVAYIALRGFYNETSAPGGSAEEFHAAMERTAWAAYTIIDLRGNTGGYVSQCLRIVGEFVPQGTAVIRSTERELRQRVPGDDNSYYGVTVDTVLYTDFQGIALNRRCYVLVDSMTASASEILVSCLHDRRSDDITTVGTVTYGKGRGQVLLGYDWQTGEFLLSDKGLARITSMRLTPILGPPYDSVRIVPRVLCPNSRSAFDTAFARVSRELGRPVAKGREGALAVIQSTLARRRKFTAPVLVDDRGPVTQGLNAVVLSNSSRNRQ